MSKTSLLGGAIALALTAAIPAFAHQTCVDDACHARLLFTADAPGGSAEATGAVR